MNTIFKFIFIICVFCTAHVAVFAQGIAISGVITDETGEPLPGANVVIKGTIVGVVANADGAYRITAPNAEAVLQFSFVGYSTTEVTVGSQRIINITLSEDAAQLGEVVVIGYGTQRKESVTSAISSIQTAELLKSPTTSLGNALAGRLPGFSAIQYSGLPGHDDPTVYIRGVGTLHEGNSRPLILVDGVERPFTQLDPNEVADISILKDAGATAVFGVRGANGVILVTTKRGQSGKATVTVSASAGIQQPVKIVEFADSYLYATTYNEAQRRDGVDPRNFAFKPDVVEHYRLGDQPVLYPSIDWMSYIMKDYAWQNQFNVNVTGGNDRARYFVSVGKLYQDGLFNTFASDPRENFKYNRYNYRANLDIDLTKSTLLSVNLGGRIEDRNTTNDPYTPGGADGWNREGTIFRYLVESPPMAGAGIVDGKRITYDPTLLPSFTFTRDGLTQHYARGFKNEVVNVLNFDLKLSQKLDFITPGLEVNLKGAYNNSYGLEKVRPTHNNGEMGVSSYRPRSLKDENGNLTYVLEKMTDSQVLEYNEYYSYGRDWYFDASFNYSRRFAEAHNVTALLLYNQTKKYYPDSYKDIPNGYTGLVGRITYDYRMKYLLDMSMGYNGSENFAEGKRYGFFPSASVGWTLTEENFMKGQKILDYLKIRYSFGIVGNDGGVGRFVYLPAAYSHRIPSRAWPDAGGTYFGIMGESQVKPNVREESLGNPNVSWEKSRKQNIGLDLKSLNNRLGVNFDYFTEHRRDILISPQASIPDHFALPNVPAINYGIVDNWGYELSLTWSDKIGSDFSYTVAPNMSFTRNKRVEMLEIPPVEPYLTETGTKVGQPFGYAFYGYYHEGIEDEYKRNTGSDVFPDHGVTLKPGDCVYEDLNRDGQINGNDQHAIGFPNYPEYYFGLNLNFKYKRFELSMLWIGAANTDRDLAGAYRPPFGGTNSSALVKWVAENSWTEDNPNAAFPRITFANRDNNTRFSEVYLVNAAYARLKNVEIGYDVNMSKIPYIDNLRLFATGYNLLTFTRYKANDPETSGAGYGEFFRYPPTRVYNIGIRLSF